MTTPQPLRILLLVAGALFIVAAGGAWVWNVVEASYLRELSKPFQAHVHATDPLTKINSSAESVHVSSSASGSTSRQATEGDAASPTNEKAKAAPTLPSIETPNPWFYLDRFQGTITRAEFEERITGLFDPFHGLPPYMEINDEQAAFYATASKHSIPQFVLKFAPKAEARAAVQRPFRTPEEFRVIPKAEGKPLDGLRIAIDPGHIGGQWAMIEERCTKYHGSDYVKEGDLNLITAHILRERLKSLGATVYMVREANEPVTPYRPADFIQDARTKLIEEAPRKQAAKLEQMSPDQQQRALGQRVSQLANFLFYRSSEISERGAKIRRDFQPDITITLYINATPNSSRGGLVRQNRNIFFVHGAYMKKEVDDSRQRLRMIYKILENTTPIEVDVAEKIADAFKRITGHPPVLYGDSSTTRRVSANSYVVARNLAANREYNGPVVCTEPYFMNEVNTYPRLLAGDFEGEKKLGGKMCGSIFREYAQCVVEGANRSLWSGR